MDFHGGFSKLGVYFCHECARRGIEFVTSCCYISNKSHFF